MLNKADKKLLQKIEGFCAEMLEDNISAILERLNEKYDNASEKWQESDKGQETQNLISQLEEVVSNLETLQYSINDIEGLME